MQLGEQSDMTRLHCKQGTRCKRARGKQAQVNERNEITKLEGED
jgi:hypothetical protein